MSKKIKRKNHKPSDHRKIQEPVGDLLLGMSVQEALDKEYEWDQEADESSYCHHYGPCERCKERAKDSDDSADK